MLLSVDTDIQAVICLVFILFPVFCEPFFLNILSVDGNRSPPNYELIFRLQKILEIKFFTGLMFFEDELIFAFFF
jgi:hypothetical protein